MLIIDALFYSVEKKCSFGHLAMVCLALLAGVRTMAQNTACVDSLMNTWPVQEAVEKARQRSTPGVIRAIETNDLYDVLRDHVVGLPVFADSAVVRYVDLFGEPRREQFRVVLGMAHRYSPMIEAQLQAVGLPPELKYLPLALSAMNPLAASNSGEAGLWMLSYPVALRYGLTVNELIDERKDPLLSTIAAVRYLTDLHDQYDDADLAVMAFACGPANVVRAQQRSGSEKDVRLLYPHFDPSERHTMPLLMAFIYLSTRSTDLGIAAIPVPLLSADTLRHPSELNIAVLTNILGLPAAQFRAMNPVLCGDRIPAYRSFLVPVGQAVRFTALSDSIAATQVAMTLAASAVARSPSDEVKRTADGREAIYYRVRPGDYLGRIAAKFNVGVSELKRWNQLRNDHIDVGEQLMVFVPASKRSRYEAQADSDQDEPEAPTEKPEKPSTEEKKGEPYEWYTVRSGDSLYLIAKRYPGIDADRLMKFNGIKADIRPGQRIKIPAR